MPDLSPYGAPNRTSARAIQRHETVTLNRGMPQPEMGKVA
jgi:hypothetical protein